MAFESLALKKELTITNIITIHYFEYRSDFHFPGESHNFWEFVCVDKGEVEVVGGVTAHTLHKGEIIFHKPNEFHSLHANGITAPNLVVMTFECNSPCMSHFENCILTITETERNLLAHILSEARHCLSSPLDDPYLEKMTLSANALFGSEQLIATYLEEMLLLMIRRQHTNQPSSPPVKSIKKKNDSLLYNRITTYLEEHIREHLTIEEICLENLIGRSQLQKLFREQEQCGVIDYFSKLKIELAKQLIRENHYNFTQISDFLGYTSIHYFSRQFKKITRMTPSEYASSIKVLSERK